ncbi:MAG: Sec-independent protein translocase TatB [Actinobacteria bacterium]|nr:Sec-independent protein translocase TatB [Actinomycetota bacterium]
MFGINPSEFIVLLAVAAIVLGPERLPQYAQSLARLVRELRRMAQGAGDKVREELGPEFDEVDWRKLDPRQYDPRRIVREALSDADFDPADPLGLRNGQGANGSGPKGSGANGAARNGSNGAGAAPDGEPAPAFDPDAT